MCSNPFKKPKTPKVEPIPERQPMVLPDSGDPSVRGALKGQRRLTMSSMIFANRQGKLGSPTTTAPLGSGGL